MNHHRYLSDNKRICDKPSRLGYDNIICDHLTEENPLCKICSDLLFTHNLRDFEREHRWNVAYTEPMEMEMSGAKAFVLGVVLSSLIWIAWFALYILVT